MPSTTFPLAVQHRILSFYFHKKSNSSTDLHNWKHLILEISFLMKEQLFMQISQTWQDLMQIVWCCEEYLVLTERYKTQGFF